MRAVPCFLLMLPLAFAFGACSSTDSADDSGTSGADAGAFQDSGGTLADAGAFQERTEGASDPDAGDAGSDEPTCIAEEGEGCESTQACCRGMLCLPAGDGGTSLSCQRVTCEPLGTLCEPGADDCCPGTTCRPTSELTFACQRDVPGTDAGTPDGGGTCLANQSACSSPAVCCSMICEDGVCGAPATCQPQSGACTRGADCCEGLTCEFSADSDTGAATCQPGGCGVAGQGCTSSSSCCDGLLCLNASNAACDGTGPCSCEAPSN